MIVLLAAGIGVCMMGLLAVGFGIPISDTSFGNALLIAGVVILCTGLILLGMWFVARELVGLTKLVVAQGTQGARPVAPPRPANPFAATAAEPSGQNGAMDRAASPPPWADEAAARAKPPAPAPDVQPAEPAAPCHRLRPIARRVATCCLRPGDATRTKPPPRRRRARRLRPNRRFRSKMPGPIRRGRTALRSVRRPARASRLPQIRQSRICRLASRS